MVVYGGASVEGGAIFLTIVLDFFIVVSRVMAVGVKFFVSRKRRSCAVGFIFCVVRIRVFFMLQISSCFRQICFQLMLFTFPSFI